MATPFWDCGGEVLVVVAYLPQQTTMTGQYYRELLRNLYQAIKDK